MQWARRGVAGNHYLLCGAHCWTHYPRELSSLAPSVKDILKIFRILDPPPSSLVHKFSQSPLLSTTSAFEPTPLPFLAQVLCGCSFSCREVERSLAVHKPQSVAHSLLLLVLVMPRGSVLQASPKADSLILIDVSTGHQKAQPLFVCLTDH